MRMMIKMVMIAVLKWLMRIRIEFVISVVETMAWQYLSSHVMWTNSMRDWWLVICVRIWLKYHEKNSITKHLFLKLARKAMLHWTFPSLKFLTVINDDTVPIRDVSGALIPGQEFSFGLASSLINCHPLEVVFGFDNRSPVFFRTWFRIVGCIIN